jgi:hypothetical protein
MSDDFVTQLRLQLREAALQEERRTPAARRLFRARNRVPGPLPLAAALAVALLALAVAIGARWLRGEPTPSAPRVIHTFSVADGLSSMQVGYGAVWASDLSRGDVLRIDPSTRRVVARIPAGREVRVGRGGGSPDVVVATGAGAVWALASDHQNSRIEEAVRLLRIDPHSNRVVARISMRKPSGGTFSPQRVQVAGDAVWVVGSAGALEIDPQSNAPESFVPTGSAALGVVPEGDTVWTLSLGGRLRQIDAGSRRTLHTLSVPVPTGTYLIPGGPGLLMLDGGGRLSALDPGDGRTLWTASFEAPIRFWAPGGEDTLWVYLVRSPELRDRVVRVDAGSGRRTGQVDVPEPGAAGLARVGRELWAASPDGTIVVIR